MLLILLGREVINDNIVMVVAENDKVIENELKDRFTNTNVYEDIYDYKYISLGDINFLKLYKNVDIKFDKVNGNTSEKIKKCFDIVCKFKYIENQSNPNLVEEKGGNCHALSIYFKYLCLNNGIYSEIELTDTHAYNLVKLGNKVYKIDITNKIIEEVTK